MKITSTIDSIIDAAQTSSEPDQVTLDELASVHGGSGLLTLSRPSKPDQHSNSQPYGLSPYSPPLEIPNIPSPIELGTIDVGFHDFDPGIGTGSY
jgi:hypothetical protein